MLPTFSVLYESPLVRIEDYICRAGYGGPGGEEHHAQNTIVLMRQGTFCKHLGRRFVTADVNQAIFFSKGSTARVSHPGDCGDRGTVFALSPAVLNDIVREIDPSVEERPDQPFSFASGPCEPETFLRHRQITRELGSGDRLLEPIRVEETVLQLSAEVLQAAFAQAGLLRPRRRRAALPDHAERVEAAREILSKRMAERITLNEVAEAVHTSPFHFSRIFHLQTGLPVHRYLTRLRLRASVERLADGAPDLTALALDLGFASHAHFTDAFRKEFGTSPSEVRRSGLSKGSAEPDESVRRARFFPSRASRLRASGLQGSSPIPARPGHPLEGAAQGEAGPGAHRLPFPEGNKETSP